MYELSKMYSSVIEGLVILEHAIFGSRKICIVQDFDFARTESCKIWIRHDLDCLRFGSELLETNYLVIHFVNLLVLCDFCK